MIPSSFSAYQTNGAYGYSSGYEPFAGLHKGLTPDDALTEQDWYKVATAFYHIDKAIVLKLPVFAESADFKRYSLFPIVDLAAIWLNYAAHKQDTVTMRTLAKDFASVGLHEVSANIQPLFPNTAAQNEHASKLSNIALNDEDYCNLQSIFEQFEIKKKSALLRIMGGIWGSIYDNYLY